MITLRKLVLVLLLLCCSSCARTEAGLAREQSIYQAGTNTVGILERYVVPLVPPPYTHMIEGVLALFGAGLAAWNLHQQRSLNQIRNGLLSGSAPGAVKEDPLGTRENSLAGGVDISGKVP